MSYWGVRNYSKYLRKRGGYAPGFKSWHGNKGPQIYNDMPFRFDGNAAQPNDAIAGRRTGGRTSGRNYNQPTIRPDGTWGGSRAKRRPNNEVDTNKVKDGPLVPWQIPHYNIPSPNFPVTIPINFGKINRKRIRPSHAGSTFSYSKLFAPKRIRQTKTVRALSKQVPNQYCEYMLPWRTETLVGEQNYFAYNWLSVPVLNNMVSGATGTSGPKTGTVYLKGGVLSVMMTNNSNANAFIEIWEGYYRKSCKDSASTMWKQGLTDQGATGPVAHSSYPDLLYGMDPLKSRFFTQFCRVTDVKSLELGPGRSHQHRSRLYANLKYNNEIYYEYNPNTFDYLGGVTRFVFVIARGAPINSLATPGNVTTAITALDFIATTKYNYMYVQPNTTGLYTSMTFPTVTDPEIVNEMTGTGTTNTKW